MHFYLNIYAVNTYNGKKIHIFLFIVTLNMLTMYSIILKSA